MCNLMKKVKCCCTILPIFLIRLGVSERCLSFTCSSFASKSVTKLKKYQSRYSKNPRSLFVVKELENNVHKLRIQECT